MDPTAEDLLKGLEDPEFLLRIPEESPQLLAYQITDYSSVKRVVFDPRLNSTVALFVQNEIEDYDCVFYDAEYRFYNKQPGSYVQSFQSTNSRFP